MQKWVLLAFLLLGCDNRSKPYLTDVAQKGTAGEQLFNGYCVACHGAGARGTERGPTFLSKIYEPNHHGDAAFRLAIQNGVRAHHWGFGDMPKIQGVTPGQAGEIIAYIRGLQKQAGIF
jgi:mono/diheme cytochrome c family protein